jgi:hypothetical protein
MKSVDALVGAINLDAGSRPQPINTQATLINCDLMAELPALHLSSLQEVVLLNLIPFSLGEIELL